MLGEFTARAEKSLQVGISAHDAILRRRERDHAHIVVYLTILHVFVAGREGVTDAGVGGRRRDGVLILIGHSTEGAADVEVQDFATLSG